MELTPVNSSNLDAAGYHAELRLLRVRFLDGAVYDYPDVPPEWYERFMAPATSKGRMIRDLGRGFLLGLRQQGPHPSATTAAEGVGVETQAAPAQTSTIDEDADKCCRAHLIRFLSQVDTLDPALCWPVPTLWQCPTCGTAFAPDLVGPVRHWRIKPAWAVVRR